MALLSTNEAFNQIMWKKCPKETFVARKVLDISAASAVINFNDGVCGFLKLFRNINIEFGGMAVTGAVNKDKLRVSNMDRKTQNNVKTQRQKRRAQRKGFIDKEKDNEGGDSYATGEF